MTVASRVRALAVAGLAVIALSAAPVAEAQAPSPLDRATKVAGTTVEPVAQAPGEAQALLFGRQDALGTTASVLCPPVRSVDELLEEHLGGTPLGGVGAGLTSLVCAAGLLEFEFHTRWASPGGGTVTRTTPAVVGVPIPLDVDDDPAPDLTGTITLGGGADDHLELIVSRAPGESADLPVAVEAVLTDAQKRVIGRRHLAFGYDARSDRAPGTFRVTTPVGPLLGPSGEYRFDLTQQDRGERIAVIGALFDGDVDERTDPTEVRLDYGASPGAASIRAAVRDGATATLTTNRPGPADLSGRIVEDGAEDRMAIGFRDLPSSVQIALDGEQGTISYGASGAVEKITAQLDTAEPELLGARHLEASLLGVPEAFSLTADRDTDDLSLVADRPIGQIDLRARSQNRAYPEVPAGEAGVLLDATGGELGLALRVFGLRSMALTGDPVALRTEMAPGRFRIDARLDRDGGPPIHATGVIDELPATSRLGFEERTEAGGGSRFRLAGSHPIDFLRLATDGLELLPGADEVELEIDDVPTDVTVDLPETGQVASLAANGHIGQIRLVASDGSAVLPANTLESTGADLVHLRDRPGDLRVAARLTAVRALGVGLDPVNLVLAQDASRTRPVELQGTFGSGDTPVTVDGLLDKPSARTSVSVAVAHGQPTRLVLDNAANVGRLRLATRNLGSVSQAGVTLDNIPRHLSVCLHPGAGCRRGTARPYPTAVSVDFDDNGTQTSGFTTLNASIGLDAADPVTITNVRFRELAMDFGQGSSFSCLGQSVPRIYAFVDSDGRPFVMNSIKFPPTVRNLQIGTDGHHASGQDRMVVVEGPKTLFGSCYSIDTSAAGSLNCGGDAELVVRLGFLGDVDVLNFPVFGQLLPLCSSGG